MFHTRGVLKGVHNVMKNFIHAAAVFHLRKYKRAVAAHSFGVASHHVEIGADGGREVGFVDDEEVALRDAGAAFAGDFVAARDVNDLDGVIGQFAAETGCEIIAAGFDEEDFGFELGVQFFERDQIRGDVFANGGVRAAAGFDGANAFGRESVVAHQKLAVLFCEDVVGDSGDVPIFAHGSAELEHEGGFTAADGATDADGEGAF